MRPLSAEEWKQVIPAHGFVLDPGLTTLPVISHLIVTMTPQGRFCTPRKDARGTSTEPLGFWTRPSPLPTKSRAATPGMGLLARLLAQELNARPDHDGPSLGREPDAGGPLPRDPQGSLRAPSRHPDSSLLQATGKTRAASTPVRPSSRSRSAGRVPRLDRAAVAAGRREWGTWAPCEARRAGGRAGPGPCPERYLIKQRTGRQAGAQAEVPGRARQEEL